MADGSPIQSLNEAFCDRFKVKAMPDELNRDYELMVVAGRMSHARGGTF